VTLGTACIRSKGVLSGNEFRTGETEYTVGDIPSSWRRVSLKGADLAYIHKEDGSTLLINSNCKKVEDAPLLALTYHLLIGMTDQKVLEQKTLPISDREGLETTAEVKVDGVLRKLRIFVLKKDECVYDVVVSAAPDKFEEALAAYDATLKGFNVAKAIK
jgi:hypothetical protein